MLADGQFLFRIAAQQHPTSHTAYRKDCFRLKAGHLFLQRHGIIDNIPRVSISQPQLLANPQVSPKNHTAIVPAATRMTRKYCAMTFKIKGKSQGFHQKTLRILYAQIPLKNFQGRTTIQFLQAEIAFHSGYRHDAPQRFPTETGNSLHMEIAATEHRHYHAITKFSILGKHQSIFSQAAIISQTAEKTNFPPGC